MMRPGPVSSPLPPTSLPAPSLGLSILVAEDNLANQIFITTVLKIFGCEIDLVVDGIQAVARYAEKKYDLVLLDCRMPVMDGYAAAAAIRRLEAGRKPQGPRVPIVALSAEPEGENKKLCLEAGMDDCLSKPLRTAELRQYLESFRRPDPPLSAGENT